MDTLRFWHPMLDEPILENYFPWGTVAAGSSADRIFRIRNGSATYTASMVVISVTEMGTYTPSVAAQHYLSLDNRRFTATVTVPTIGPGGVSSPVTLRRVTDTNAAPGVGDFQLLAAAGDWS